MELAVGQRRLLATLLGSIKAGSELAVDAFGPAVHQHLVNTARQEWAHFNRAVTDWERRRNFDQW